MRAPAAWAERDACPFAGARPPLWCAQRDRRGCLQRYAGGLRLRLCFDGCVDPGRLIIVETRSNKEVLWALEEALRSPARLATVAGVIAGGLDLTTSRR